MPADFGSWSRARACLGYTWRSQCSSCSGRPAAASGGRRPRSTRPARRGRAEVDAEGAQAGWVGGRQAAPARRPCPPAAVSQRSSCSGQPWRCAAPHMEAPWLGIRRSPPSGARSLRAARSPGASAGRLLLHQHLAQLRHGARPELPARAPGPASGSSRPAPTSRAFVCSRRVERRPRAGGPPRPRLLAACAAAPDDALALRPAPRCASPGPAPAHAAGSSSGSPTLWAKVWLLSWKTGRKGA